MDKQSFNQIVHGKDISAEELKSLEELTMLFPYFQLPHILIAKEYVKQESAQAEIKLRRAATYTSDRKNLKHFILDKKQPFPAEEENVQEDLLREEVREESKNPIHEVVENLPEVVDLVQKENTEIKEENPVPEKESLASIGEKEKSEATKHDAKEENPIPEKENLPQAEAPVEKQEPEGTEKQEEIKEPIPVKKAESKVPAPIVIHKPEIKDEEAEEKQELRDDIQKELEILRKQKEAFEALIRDTEIEKAHKSKESVKSKTEFKEQEKPKKDKVVVKEDKPVAKTQKEKKEPGKQAEKKPAPKSKKPATKNTNIKKGVYKAPRTDTRMGYFLGKENENTGDTEPDSGADFILGYLDEIDKKRKDLFEDKEDTLSIIDEFIKNDPKISKPVRNAKNEDLSVHSIQEKPFISENLALINARQGNISKAIEIYEQLLLRNPHKKLYFAAQIEKLKKQ